MWGEGTVLPPEHQTGVRQRASVRPAPVDADLCSDGGRQPLDAQMVATMEGLVSESTNEFKGKTIWLCVGRGGWVDG